MPESPPAAAGESVKGEEQRQNRAAVDHHQAAWCEEQQMHRQRMRACVAHNLHSLQHLQIWQLALQDW
jgi:hypothetical protein